MATTKRIHSSPDWDMTPLCHSRVMDTMPRSTEFFGQRQAGENWQCRCCCCCCCCWCCCCYRSWIFKQIQAQRENNEIMVSWSKLGPFSTYERKRWRKLSDVAALCCLHPTKTECPAIFLLISTWSYMNRCPQNCHAPGVFFPKKNIWLKGHCCFFYLLSSNKFQGFQLLQSGLFLSTQTYRTFLLVVAFVIGRFWPGPARSVSFGKLETFVYCFTQNSWWKFKKNQWLFKYGLWSNIVSTWLTRKTGSQKGRIFLEVSKNVKSYSRWWFQPVEKYLNISY